MKKRIYEWTNHIIVSARRLGRTGEILILSVALCACLFAAPGSEHHTAKSEYSFVYLGDMHLDQTAHHDFQWLQANYPQDQKQIEEYTANTEQYTPHFLKQIRTQIDSSSGRIQMVIQGGDFTEGLCGSYELQLTQFLYARDIIRHELSDIPFVITKGNHDITGPGAVDAFNGFMLPWMSKTCGKQIESASFYFMKGSDLFVIFDAYNNNNLDWLEKTLKENKHRHAFVVMHPPAVPYGARSSWHLFSKLEEKDIREQFLNILGRYRTIVLTGHLHKYSVLGRQTPTGSFVQLSINSVIASAEISVKDPIEGVKNYNGSLVTLEPDFQPDTTEQRKQRLEDEREYVTYFEYADFPGYAIVNVSDATVTADIYAGFSDKKWKNVNLGDILDK